MTDAFATFASLWTSVSSDRAGDPPDGAPRHASSGHGWLGLDDTPAYPLARTVDMPPGHPYETGALSFRLSDLRLRGIEDLDVGACGLERQGDRSTLRLAWRGLDLDGRYSLDAKPDPIVAIDTGGDLMELPPDRARPGLGGSDPAADPSLDPEKEQWLEQARGQRDRLGQTPNGQALMGTYNQHNETFNQVFRENKSLPPLWQAGGATKAMAADTASAVGNDHVVNPHDKLYPGDVTYNSNAFTQQLNVASACLWTDPGFDPETGPSVGSKFWEAAKAALSFGATVGQSTGNSKDNTNPMVPSQVHAVVDQHSGELAPVTDDQLMDVMATGAGSGGSGERSTVPSWIVIDEDDRRRLRHIYEATMKQRADDAGTRGRPLFAGTCRARIAGATAEFSLEIGPDDHVEARDVAVTLPAFDFDVDDGAWSGEAGRVARLRLESMYFIRSLLHDAVEDGLAAAIRERAAATLRLATSRS